MSFDTPEAGLPEKDVLEQAFLVGIDELDLSIARDFKPYKQYLQLLEKWNQTYNLTAIHNIDSMLRQHVLDSLAVFPYIEGDRCLDVGTGAGLPGLILAIANPTQQWTLIDSNIKKTRFVNQVKLELQLENISVVHARVEDLNEQEAYDTVISRAFTSLPLFYKTCIPLRQQSGVLLAMKAGYPQSEHDEMKRIRKDIEFKSLKVPGLEQARGLFLIRS